MSIYGHDKDGLDLALNETVIFVSARKKTKMEGKVCGPVIGQMLEVKIEGDPFTVMVPYQQVTKKEQGKMPKTDERPSRKEMRRQADALGIAGWEALTTSELEAAIAKATSEGDETESSNGHKAKVKKAKKKGLKRKKVRKPEPVAEEVEEEEPEPDPKPRKKTAKAKAPAKVAKAPVKKATKAAATKQVTAREPAPNGNPFRKGSNLYIITEELLKGGRRASIINRLQSKIELHPWSKKPKDVDTSREMDKRMLLTKNLLMREYGFTFDMTGRGAENGTVKGYPPAAKAKKAKAK